MGLFDFNQDKEAVYVAALGKRNSDVGDKCTKCGSHAEYTTRPWCIDEACEYFCPKTLARYSAAKLDEVPEIDGFMPKGVSPAPLPTISGTAYSQPSNVPPREDWPLHNPTKKGAMTEHWTSFLAKLDEWSGHLLLTAPSPSGSHVRLEVSGKNIALNNPPFSPGAEFDILKILRKRPEWTKVPAGPLLGYLDTPKNNIEVFVDNTLPSDVCSFSVGDWTSRHLDGYYMFIDLRSPHKTPPVNACTTIGGPSLRSAQSQHMALTKTSTKTFQWPIFHTKRWTNDEHRTEFLKLADDAISLFQHAGLPSNLLRIEVSTKLYILTGNGAFNMLEWLKQFPEYKANVSPLNPDFRGVIRHNAICAQDLDVVLDSGLPADTIAFSCGDFKGHAPDRTIYGLLMRQP